MLLSYLCLRVLLFPFQWLPYPLIHAFGYVFGHVAYYLLPQFRKRTLSNLKLASTLQVKNEALIPMAKAAFVNLMITCLEYPKLFQERDIHKIATCDNPSEAAQLMKEGKPVIFFCGHQSNWEVLFLEGTKRMPGVAIGRPIANTYLYNWVLSIRQKYGGKIIPPNQAIKEGLRGLKRGSFLGIVGDQGRPDSGYSCPFFGRRAWSSPMPAILSYRTGSPIMVASTRRLNGKYITHYSDPIWPDTSKPMEEETDRMMRKALYLLEESIREAPDQWLWVHNRWKQQTLHKIKRRYRQECFCIILPADLDLAEKVAENLSIFRTLYPLEFITVFAPKQLANRPLLNDAEIIGYNTLDEVEVIDYRFKLVFNFSQEPRLSRHFKGLSAITTVDLPHLDPKALQELISNAS